MPKSSLNPEGLAFSLDRAARAVDAVLSGTALPAALSRATIGVPANARAAAQDLSYRAMRRLGATRALLAALARQAPAGQVRGVLLCALALLLDAPGEAAYPPFTIVDQAVAAVAANVRTASAKGFVNAVLRRFLREQEMLTAQVMQQPEARWNYPLWWIDAVRHAWPTQWESILAAGDTRGPLTVRVNRRRATLEAALASLRAAGLDGEPGDAMAIRLARAVPVERLPGFQQGLLSVQDAGAQLAGPLLWAADGMRVLDACAAPGGKTGHLLELADLDLVALEADAGRADRIHQNLDRLGLHATVCVGDAGDPAQWWDGRRFDRILADVPCSASGIVRRHPDIRWLRRADDIPRLVQAQRRIMQALWSTLAVGGELLYVTCSIFPDENEAQAQWFERFSPDAVRLDAPGQLLPTPDGAHDGFFYARFRKR